MTTTSTGQLPTGFYRLPRVDRLNALLGSVGYQADVVCVSLEAGLNFRRRDTSEAGILRSRRSFHALGQALRCIDQLSGFTQLAVPGFVTEPRNVPDGELVRVAHGVGYMNDKTNRNPASLGSVMAHTPAKPIAMGQPIADAPGKYYVYIDTTGPQPLIVTGTCLDVWHRLPHGLQAKQIELIKKKVYEAGRSFSFGKLWVFISPGGRNDGFSISREGYDRLLEAGPEYRYYLYQGGGTSAQKPHGLDLAGLSYRQAELVGIPPAQIGGLHGESTITARDGAGNHKWGSMQAQGEDFASSIIAGVIRPATS